MGKDNFDAMRIAAKARELRAAFDLSLSAAAERIGCSKSHLWNFEQGIATNPTLQMLRGLADAYGITLVALIDEGEPSPRLHPEALKIAFQVHAAINRATR